MDVIERMRADRQRIAEDLDNLTREKAELETKERAKRTQLAEIENALRVAERYAAAEDANFALSSPVASSDQPTIDDALWQVFSDHPEGRKISAVVDETEKRYGLTINRKTAGNYFWNWGLVGRARRDGHVWYPVRPQ